MRDGGAVRGVVSGADGALALFHPSRDAEGIDSTRAARDLAELRERWGTQEYCDKLLELTCPSLLASDADRLWFAN